MHDYPRNHAEVMVLYTKGFSVSRFLVGARGHETFLAFVKLGMRTGWDPAVRKYYGFRNVERLERAWHVHLRTIDEWEARLEVIKPAVELTNSLVIRAQTTAQDAFWTFSRLVK
jgi:hypothetical protein